MNCKIFVRRRDCDVIEELSCNLTGENEENHEKPQSG
jgi:hypothetical protein